MISGRVDDYGRALVPVKVGHPTSGLMAVTLEAWIDTGFTGRTLLTAGQIASLGLPRQRTVIGGLADGSLHVFESYACQIEWFGRQLTLDALAGSGQFALVGVPLMEDCTLTIDYPGRSVTLSALPGLPSWP
jgi:predicted aspartyl protease